MITIEDMPSPVTVKVCHLSSVHKRYDVRIFYKQCRSLAQRGYDVTFIIADSKGNERKDNVNIVDVGAPYSRIQRIAKTIFKVYKKALAVNADVYHFHDPELLSLGLLLRLKGKKVIYDVHEDLPRQVLGKAYMKPRLKKALSVFIEWFENHTAGKMSGIITATPFIRDRFLRLHDNTIDINNFPLLEEKFNNTNWDHKKDVVCYVGGISEVRGVKQMVQAMEKVHNGTRFNLGGSFESEQLHTEVKQYKGWQKVNEYGFVNRDQVSQILSESKVGIVTLQPIINYIDSLPVKMFEYMLAGIPVIASDFPVIRGIIDKANCGICVDPENPNEIANAINSLMADPENAKKLGTNGYQAVLSKFNWNIEEQKLFSFYDKILDNVSSI
ncbi:glycosyltransferase family 4 protein [Solitalea koreensis]|uniref:Glycosyltransferase involved in cell wall bisynthesis n=1 Tax=Solitalea koreensis TaxID=543615 RepID=A0A521AND4_9SPHI|nr:glycosyltransferase family 4 protein [Solitalea koreensis]SMO36281.1 Glycosyltransferase involved in cell wall bisynthesis [Solitalea koreensis]